MSLQALQDYIFTTKYARRDEKKKRRETYEESVDRVLSMYEKKFAGMGVEADIEFCRAAMKEKLVLGSQRALQFGGAPIEKKNARMYNCTTSYCDRPRFFQECLWLLLCGCGTGFSVQKHHVANLPPLLSPDRSLPVSKFRIPDTIEGWGDSLGVLLAGYGIAAPEFIEWKGLNVEIDYSEIRPKGAALSSGSGKAPGPEPLRGALDEVRKLLDRCIDAGQTHLRSIDAYDIVMHASDAVLSGGVRRSATICLFSVDDQDMITAKTGDWFIKNAQRGRSNNSAVLLRDTTSRETFAQIMKSTRECGEPGFVWSDSTEIMYNPCQPASAPVITEAGLRCFGDIKTGDRIWSKEGWTTVVKKWKTGVKKVFRYDTSAGFFIGTDKHRIISKGAKVEVGQATSIEVLRGPTPATVPVIDLQDVIDGLVLGDGTQHSQKPLLCIGLNDQSYLTSEVADYIGGTYSRDDIHTIKTNVDVTELLVTYLRRIPQRYTQTVGRACGVLRGLFSANGSVHSGRVVLKATSHAMIQDVQLILSSIGIKSYVTTNKAKPVEFSNGTYVCRQSYDLNITNDIGKFEQFIGFIQPYKQDKLRVTVLSRVGAHQERDRRLDHKILTTTFIGEEDVFDITVDNESHTYWTGGHNVSNCVEIGLYPTISLKDYHDLFPIAGIKSVDDSIRGEIEMSRNPVDDDKLISGWAFCNLCEINAKKCTDYETWKRAATAAAILGTFQCSYTNFPYLGLVSEAIAQREALLGVSMTGIMDNPTVVLDPELQRKVAGHVLFTNEHIAKKIGVRPTARATCVKPAGTTSCILGTSSGIHPHHAPRYLRRAQGNELESPLQYYALHNPKHVEMSVWSKNKTDKSVIFCVETVAGAHTKETVSALQLLEFVKLTQMNWVDSGRVLERCAAPFLRHNVSNTINIKPNEWDAVEQFIFNNRAYFAGISLLSHAGDRDYPQAPFCQVFTPDEIIEMYGDAGLMASGLIVDGLHAFNDNLWAACDCALGIGENLSGSYDGDLSLEDIQKQHAARAKKRDWVRRAKKFATNYFSGDIKKMTYCLKDVSNYKLWVDLNRVYQPVDWSLFFEETDTVKDATLDAACAGGACEILST